MDTVGVLKFELGSDVQLEVLTTLSKPENSGQGWIYYVSRG